MATKVTRIASLLVVAVFVAGCSSQDNPDAVQGTPEASQETSDDLPDEAESEPSEQGDESESGASETDDASEANSQAEGGTQAELAALTEDEIVDVLAASDLPITDLEVFDSETDPNDLLGRPGQYTVKISWEDGRLTDSLDPSGTLEVFPDAESMQRRADYIEEIGQEAPMLLQWIFTDERTGAVLRVPSDLTQEQADEYEVLLKSLV